MKKRPEIAQGIAPDKGVEFERMRTLWEMSMALSGEPYQVFDGIVRLLAENFSVPIACLSEMGGEQSRHMTLFENGRVSQQIAVTPVGQTPCGAVMESGQSCVYDRAARRFSKTPFLRERNIEFFCGVPCLAADGTVVAVVCLMDPEPREFPQGDLEILRICCKRIAAEMERFGETKKRRRAALELKASEARLSGILAITSEAVISADARHNITLFSKGAEEIFGYAADEIIGKPVTMLMPDQAAAQHPHLMDAFGESDEISRHREKRLKIRGRHKSGREFLGEASISKIHVGGELLFTVMMQDITERRKTEVALEESEKRLHSVIENCPASIVLKDLEGRFQVANPVFLQWSGRRLEDVLGARSEVIFPDENGRIFAEQDRWVLEHRKAREWETVVEFPDGSEHLLSIARFPVFNAEGDLSGLGSMAFDVTDRKQAEEKLRRALEETRAANKAKEEFLATMSHELRTPLNAIIGFSQVIRDEVLGPVGTEKYRDYAADIHFSGGHLLELINDVLDLAKIESRRDDLHEEKVVVAEVIRSVRTLVKGRAEQAKVRLAFDMPDDLPKLFVDNRKLKQALVNIMSNGIKFTDEGGSVTLKAYRDGTGEFVFQVADTGIGIAPADLPKALSTFGQVDSRLSRKYQGTGLGLPLAKALVEQHGGSFELASEVGAGTTVTLRFPESRIVED